METTVPENRLPIHLDTEETRIYHEVINRIQSDVWDIKLQCALLGFYRCYKDLLMFFPAGKYHHSYSGGLLNHTLEVETYCKYCVELQEVDCINTDILYSSAFWHDVGKAFVEDTSMHDTRSSEIAREWMEVCAVPPNIIDIVCSCVEAHMKLGSEHRYAESRILHAADSLSAFAELPKDVLNGTPTGEGVKLYGYGTLVRTPEA